MGLRSAAGADGRIGQTIGERKIRKPNSALGGADEQIGIRLEVGVQTQRGAPHHDSHVVAVIGCGEFSGDESPQPPQPGGCRALPAHLAVERMRHPHLHAAVDAVERDQATRVGLLDRCRDR